jgi:Bacterial regulatory proteins, luxR family
LLTVLASAKARQVLAQAIEMAEAAQAGWLAATGAGKAQIARQLSVSVSTAETHLERIYAKLGIHSRHELIAPPRAAASCRPPRFRPWPGGPLKIRGLPRRQPPWHPAMLGAGTL